MSFNVKKNVHLSLKVVAMFIGVSFFGIQTANAQLFGTPAFSGWGCGFVNTPPAAFHMDDQWGFLVVSSTSTVLTPNNDGLSIIRHFHRLQRVDPLGAILWTRSVTIQSFAIATVVAASPPYPASFWVSENLNLFNHQGSPWLMWARQCLNITQVKLNGVWYFVMVVGTTASSGSDEPVATTQESINPPKSGLEASVVGKDKTIERVVVIRASDGTVARTLNFKPLPGWYTIIAGSGVHDMNNNGVPEYVLSRGKFIGESRYDTRIESYNLLTGQLQNSTTLTQRNPVNIQGQ